MRTNGQIGYDAYRAKTGGVSLATGQPIPEWKELRPDIQEAWEAAGEAVAKEPDSLTFARFSKMNRARCGAPTGFNHALNSWSLSDWFTAFVGEVGEAANVAKKLNRVRDGVPGNKESLGVLQAKLREELADAYTYLDLLCQAAGVNLWIAVLDKFEKKSREIGYVDPPAVEG